MADPKKQLSMIEIAESLAPGGKGDFPILILAVRLARMEGYMEHLWETNAEVDQHLVDLKNELYQDVIKYIFHNEGNQGITYRGDTTKVVTR